MKESNNLILIGYGGHAISVLSTIQHLDLNVIGYVDDRENHADHFSLKYLGSDDEYLDSLRKDVVHISAIGDNKTRQRVYRKYEEHGALFTNIIHPTACVEATSIIGKGVFIGAFVYINGLVRIGDGSIINNHANIEHGCVIKEFSHIGPSSVLAGNVCAGSRVFLGSGAKVIPEIQISDDVIIGAGSTLIHDVNASCTLVGSPARRIDA